LDTSVVIAYLDSDEAVSSAATVILDEMVATERNEGLLSAISATELLVRPLAAGPHAAGIIRTFLLGFPGLSIRSTDLLVAAEAARIRAQTRATTPDAIIAATATVTSAPWLITNDRSLRDRLAGFDWATRVVLLSEVV
jgi:predicted nucleic acid-binding protein